MEDWQRYFEWLRIRHFVKDAFGKSSLPDFQSVLFLIGIQELGRFDAEQKFTKEEKQDLMHIAVCTLLEKDGFYEFVGRDHDGWPHFKEEKPFTVQGVKEQETYLIDKMIEYFSESYELDNNNFESNN